MNPRRTLLLVLLATALLFGSAHAQYLYLDSNGDGVHSSADVVKPSGVTVVDVWLHTDTNRDGSPATCSTADGGFTINSYEIILRAVSGSVAWGTFTNRQPEFTTVFGLRSGGSDFYAGQGGGTILPPGLYRLCTLEVTRTTGFPSLSLATSTPLGGPFLTSFGSTCSGLDYDNTLKLAQDWFDADGLGYGGQAPVPPELGPVADMSVPEEQVADQDISATDVDGDLITFSKSSGPGFMAVTTSTTVTGSGTGRIRLRPGGRDGGSYVAGVRASDGFVSDEQGFRITVIPVRAPINLASVPNLTAAQHATAEATLTATSPDANRITFGTTTPLPFVFIGENPKGFSGFIFVRPNLRADVGTWPVTIYAQDEVASDFENTIITVLPNPIAPTTRVVPPSEIEVNSEVVVAISVADLDGDEIASVSFDPSTLPASDVTSLEISGTGSTRAGSLRWIPSQAGSFSLAFTATDVFGMSGSQSALVQVHSRRPIVTAPARVQGTPLTLLSFAVQTSDPDGDPIQSLLARPYGGAALFPPPANPGFQPDAARTSGIFTWIPPGYAAIETRVSETPIWIEATDGDLNARAIVWVALANIDSDHLDTDAFDFLVGNGGQFAYDLFANRAGFVFPRESQHTLVFSMGPWVAGFQGGALRVSRGGGPDTEFFPGTMTGTAPAPFDPRFRNYKILRADPTGDDFRNWPVGDGAPVDRDGAPRLEGDQLIWSVSNDASLGARFSNGSEYDGETPPAGLELRQTTFAFAAPGPLSKIAFARFTLTNRSSAAMESTRAAIWSDADVGGSEDDLAGCDPALDLGFVYNAPGVDEQYGASSPAFGVSLLDAPPEAGPSRAAAFQAYDRLETGALPVTAPASLELMRGRNRDGSPLHSGGGPAGAETRFRFDGDPVAGTGWLDTSPGDKRIVLASGPFALPPGETREYTAAFLVGDGGDPLRSVGDLKTLVPIARYVASCGYRLLPYVELPKEIVVSEGSPLRLAIRALDLDGDPLTSLLMDAGGLPLGSNATFTLNATFSEGILEWTPAFDHAGVHELRFVASNAQSAAFTTQVRVLDANRAPVASTDGPYAGVAGLALAMDGAASGDPDGDALTYHWTFGDGTEGAGARISKTYGTGGSFTVTFEVSDGRLASQAGTTATIAAAIEARAFALGRQGTIRLGNQKPAHCFQIEPIGGSYSNTDVLFETIVLISHGSGAVDSIPVSRDKSTVDADHDENGIAELPACFSKDDLRRLFANLASGATIVDAALEGMIATGARFRAPLRLTIFGTSALVASMSPNPLNPEAVLTFRTKQEGRVRITVFDVRGRSVRSLLDEQLPPGYHDVRFDGRSESGRRLASGVYFYTISAPDGEEQGKFSILK